MALMEARHNLALVVTVSTISYYNKNRSKSFNVYTRTYCAHASLVTSKTSLSRFKVTIGDEATCGRTCCDYKLQGTYEKPQTGSTTSNGCSNVSFRCFCRRVVRREIAGDARVVRPTYPQDQIPKTCTRRDTDCPTMIPKKICITTAYAQPEQWS